MYTHFNNLRERPFDSNRAARFSFLGETHSEALASLIYGFVERKGFILLTGEGGSGKTTIVQELIAGLDPSVNYVYLASTPSLSTREILLRLGRGLGFRGRFRSKGLFLAHLKHFLERFSQHQSNVLLIFDDAHTLSFEALEEIRLLSNMETADRKLITILLVARPQLNEKLSHHRCKPLLQRIDIRSHIEPLDEGQTAQYISSWLQAVGLENGRKIFPQESVAALHRYSRGYPKMINILAERAIRLGYSNRVKKITPAIVEQSFQDINSRQRSPKQRKPAQEVPVRGQVVLPPPPRRLKWAAVLLVVLTVAIAVSIARWDMAGNLSRAIPAHLYTSFKAAASQNSLLFGKGSDTEPERDPDSLGGAVEYQKVPTTGAEETQTDMTGVMETIYASESLDRTGQTMIAGESDSLVELATQVYGWAGKNILDLLKRNNPGIKTVGQMQRGQEILFPPLLELSDISAYTVHIASYQAFQNAEKDFQALTQRGYETYIIPIDTARKGEFFRVTLGSFEDLQKAQEFAVGILENGISDYAQPTRLEISQQKQ